jgi:uncharacterized protein
MITLKDVENNPQILEFVRRTEATLEKLSYTDHGIRHCSIVAKRAREIAIEAGLESRKVELAEIAAFCHDIGNFLSREYHNYFGALLFHQIFQNDFDPREMSLIMQAISNHDKEEEHMVFTDRVSAIVVLADKSDVDRSRVISKSMEDIKSDIHDRVNYATTESELKIDKKSKRITLILRIDTDSVSVMEYFEIFTDRMVFCRRAAEYLGYSFGLVINNFKLL